MCAIPTNSIHMYLLQNTCVQSQQTVFTCTCYKAHVCNPNKQYSNMCLLQNTCVQSQQTVFTCACYKTGILARLV